MQQADLAFDSAPTEEGPARLTAWQPAAWTVAPGWRDVVQTFLDSPAGQRIAQFVTQRLAAGAVVYPPEPLRALAFTPLDRIRVVILGQDPYHGAGQAEGLAFSVAPGVKIPPSLRNIFKELVRDGCLQQAPVSGSLSAWAERGVLLLNSSLTVEEGLPASHAKQGWEGLTDAVLVAVAAHAPACVYLLWGAHAQAKAPLIENTAAAHGRQALVLTANHPSPLSALRPPVPFLGCGHFSAAQHWLTERDCPIDWTLAAGKH
ncbi:uracil-DNA glycosylase [Rhodoferax koreense]|uniref:Uracil-DNA glycosylase n=1 Tax=Rhodoferax koreensis TaxID=1842727 RepID=A0A1P8K371_9BURK|nr:uracil-DNA glycosylase [Rhodoferax koreense]APW40452.1 uracil-DNA glycosylase [Rhodoferax koreense]